MTAKSYKIKIPCRTFHFITRSLREVFGKQSDIRWPGSGAHDRQGERLHGPCGRQQHPG